ncbi:hypothetical protein C1646_764690 [Rhizophagus diaphanus]|nr:hypothetical protein C1646_764690 [Rhizophagus diaphanus] [Rhizophagus sp. MUCL 43196]
MTPEIFQRQKYDKPSDIYSFGMIMWELMTDGLRPPIVINAPEGYIELMKECRHSVPDKRPTATIIRERINEISIKEIENRRTTEVIKSADIGPVIINNPGAIYRSRP